MTSISKFRHPTNDVKVGRYSFLGQPHPCFARPDVLKYILQFDTVLPQGIEALLNSEESPNHHHIL